MNTNLICLKKHIFRRLHIGNRTTRGFTSYSQFGEDILLSKIFANKNDGFYVDVGAYHPWRLSNTYLLYKKGWHGINIEPNSHSIAIFNKYRRNDINLQMGVSDQESKKPYYISASDNCNTFSLRHKELMERKAHKYRFIGEEMVHCVPLRDILGKYHAGKEIDLLNMDVEGMGQAVLESNDWSAYKPKVVVIEDEEFDIAHPERSSIYSFLANKSYTCQAVIGPSLFFKR